MALSGYLLVQPDQLAAQAAVVEQRINALMEQFAAMESLVKGTSSYWNGESADVHRGAYMAFTSNIEEMVKRYREHVDDLRIMAGVYSAAERTAVTAADSLPVSNLD